MSDYDTTEKVEQTTTGYTFKVRSQRGTAVRDDDSVSATAHYESMDELQRERDELTTATIEELNRLRSNQPDEDGDDE